MAAEWQADASDVQLTSYDARVLVPTIFGPPPPFITAGFSYTDLNATDALDLPTDLYDYSLGFAWIRPINERWMLRFMFSTALATDGKNNSSDAWQFRGGVFAMYRPKFRQSRPTLLHAGCRSASRLRLLWVPRLSGRPRARYSRMSCWMFAWWISLSCCVVA